MRFRALPWLLAMLAVLAPARGIDLRDRSVSSTKQFVVFSTDVHLRQRVASYAEELKGDLLELFGETDHWKLPIVVTLERATTPEAGEPPVHLHMVETPAGQKIEINVKIGEDPAAVNLQKHLLRAILLEYAYRSAPPAGGAEFVEAPWWLVEGLVEMEQRRASGIDSGLFQRLVETNRLPPLESFLMEKPEELGPTALAVDRALAMGLVQMLLDQPGGQPKLGRLVRDWPQSNGDPMALLEKEFPAVAGNRQTLQKWWTVNLARFAAADRFQGMTVAETDKALADLLRMEFVTNKNGEKKTFSVGDFAQFEKLPGNRATLAARQTEILALGTRSNALLRPVVGDYEEIFSLLARGKTHGVGDRLAKVEQYRALVLRRTSEVADYLNWWEATQMSSRGDTFNTYLRTADEIYEQDRKEKGLIGEYLDQMESAF